LLPQFFTWTGVVVCLLGIFVFGMFGINLGYHRLLTHRGFRSPTWLEHTLVTLGVCNLQETPAFWVGMHRRHHQFADHDADPHSPGAGMWWAHIAWFLFERPGEERPVITARYAADVLRDPYYAWLERGGAYVVVLFTWAACFLAGFGGALLSGDSLVNAAWFGASILVWGGWVRTVAVWHQTWLVNSVAHRWGYRNFPTDDDSRNNLLLGVLCYGEGWHNNHHADPRSAKHGRRWWELDVAWLTIRLLAALGLATDIVRPSRGMAKS
jgi:stearoyl-CoA desaturase (delta-9 desaturase)